MSVVLDFSQESTCRFLVGDAASIPYRATVLNIPSEEPITNARVVLAVALQPRGNEICPSGEEEASENSSIIAMPQLRIVLIDVFQQRHRPAEIVEVIGIQVSFVRRFGNTGVLK